MKRIDFTCTACGETVVELVPDNYENPKGMCSPCLEDE